MFLHKDSLYLLYNFIIIFSNKIALFFLKLAKFGENKIKKGGFCHQFIDIY